MERRSPGPRLLLAPLDRLGRLEVDPSDLKGERGGSHLRQFAAVLVVLDSNAFHGDVHANRGLVRSILAAAESQFEFFVPEMVLQELDKQYAEKTKKVVREVNQAIGGRRRELRRLDIEIPPPLVRDEDRVGGYRAALEARLKAEGTEVLPVPTDLAPAVTWAVMRRKPFKQSGEGFPDAAIWLSILELARDRKPEQIVFVSEDGDFAVSRKRPGELAPDLAKDLVSRGCEADQVRLVPGIGHFADEIGVSGGPAMTRARGLVEAGAFDNPLVERLAQTRIDQVDLELLFWLDEDPWVDSVSVESIAIETAKELPDKHLRIEARAELTLLLDLDVLSADFSLAEDDVPLIAAEVDFEQPYVEAQLEVDVAVELEILVDPDATEIEIEIGELALTDEEQVSRALHGWRLQKLFFAVSSKIEGAQIDGFVPEEAIESDVDEAIVENVVDEESARLLELIEADATSLLCHLEVDIEAYLSWSSNSPTTFDADHFASLAVDEGAGAPILHGVDGGPLTVDLTAAWDTDTDTWQDLEVNTIQQPTSLLELRSKRMTASEEFELSRLTEAVEEQLEEAENEKD
jgi:predicted nucleic acid-binding protein